MVGVIAQKITDKYALWNGDCIDVMEGLPKESIHLSLSSPPFGGLYTYSSDERDLSNCKSYAQFFEHYNHVIAQTARILLPGRCNAIHCMPVPTSNTGKDGYIDFPGDIIRLHQKLGFDFIAEHAVWKEPLWVRNRTMQKNLAHMTAVNDSIYCGVASADKILIFRKKGENKIPVSHPVGFLEYAGDDSKMPAHIRALRGFTGDQKANRFSHWIWRRYASSIWDDIRMGRVLPFEPSGDGSDQEEKHCHPLQLDVCDRIVVMRSNPGERVFTPFMGVGSEAYSAIIHGRYGMGAELKPQFFVQSERNAEAAANGQKKEVAQSDMFTEEDAA